MTLDGRALPPPETKRYVLLHKPRGYVTTRFDPRGRAIVTDLVPGPARLFPVGRLDADVEGVLLMTNDGPLTHRLLHPRSGLPRVYEVEVAGRVARRELPRWRAGVDLADGPAWPTAVELDRAADQRSRLRVTFAEGRKHEVKRYCEALGHPVLTLTRIAFGPLSLGTLRPGEWRELSPREVGALRAFVGTAGRSTPR